MYILILLLVALGIVAAIIALCSKHGDDTIVEKATCSTCNLSLIHISEPTRLVF